MKGEKYSSVAITALVISVINFLLFMFLVVRIL
mgnify:CR=1 FL=1